MWKNHNGYPRGVWSTLCLYRSESYTIVNFFPWNQYFMKNISWKWFHGQIDSQLFVPLAINAEAWTFANGTQFKRRLELNFLNMEMDNEVVLYENDEIILRISALDYPDGFYVTNIELPYISSEDLGLVMDRFCEVLSWIMYPTR